MTIHGSTPSQQESASMTDHLSRNRTEDQPQAQPQANQQQRYSFADLGRVNRPAISRSPAAEVLTKTNEALVEVYKAADTSYEITTIPMDSSINPRLALSMIVIAVRDANNRTAGVAHHTLILEGSAPPITSLAETVNGVQIEVKRTAGAAYNLSSLKIINEEIERRFPKTPILLADAEVVRRDFDLTDKQLVHALAVNALLAAQDRLDQALNKPDLNLAAVGKDAALNVRTQFVSSQPQPLDAAGLPLRADVEIILSAQMNNQGTPDQSQTVLERNMEIGNLAGFLNPIWDPVATPAYAYPGQMPQFNGQQYEPPSRKFRYQFVVTETRLQALTSTAGQVFSLLPAILLRDNNMWHAALRPRHGVDSVDLQDIGALNIEANVFNDTTMGGRGPRIDTKSANFSTQDFEQLINMAIRPGLAIAMDVPECGASTWYNGAFAAAATDADAYAELYGASDYLTNGEFSKIFPRGTPITIADNNRIHMGTYIDRKGVERDLRDFDLLAILNTDGEKDKGLLDAWINSFNQQNVDIRVRLFDRFRIMSGINSSVNVTGFARRVSFDDRYITAIANAAKACGLQMRAQNAFQDQGVVTRASASMDSNLFGMGSSGLFNQGFATPQQAGGLGGFGFRWGR